MATNDAYFTNGLMLLNLVQSFPQIGSNELLLKCSISQGAIKLSICGQLHAHYSSH